MKDRPERDYSIIVRLDNEGHAVRARNATGAVLYAGRILTAHGQQGTLPDTIAAATRAILKADLAITEPTRGEAVTDAVTRAVQAANDTHRRSGAHGTTAWVADAFLPALSDVGLELR